MPPLKITPVPFKSSNLATPPSPFSPRTPITLTTRFKKPRYLPRRDIALQGPTVKPLLWMWQCHQCRQAYPLGVTRRCLEDGHHFCSGSTVVRSRKHGNKKIVKKHRACASEFDYASWKIIGDHRRASFTPATPTFKNHKKDCFHNCDYPSECRWGNKLVESQSAASPVAPILELPAQKETSQHAATTFDQLLKAINCPVEMPIGSMNLREKQKSSSTKGSPLSLSMVAEEDGDAGDEDVIMTDCEAEAPPDSESETDAVVTTGNESCTQSPKSSRSSMAFLFNGFDFGFKLS